MQKQTEFYETQLKKHVKTVSQKLHFKLNFLMDQYEMQFHMLLNMLLCFFCTTDTKIKSKHTCP
jgi:hypothetical protein